MPTITEYLKYANLQMAAEALFTFNATPKGTNLHPGKRFTDELAPEILTTGNLHASKFTLTEATKFVDPVTGWKVVEHISNTPTGFSGTLFQNNATGELVLSFRSTEFIDDAARDNEATNKLEIKDKGFAFGQIADMEKWYRELLIRVDGEGNPLVAGKQLTLTGYSLGGQLTTAFNLIHGQETLADGQPLVKQVINFNGAGLGRIGDGSLETMRREMPRMIAHFDDLRRQAASGSLEQIFASDAGRNAYRALKSALAATGGVPPESPLELLAIIARSHPDSATDESFAVVPARLTRDENGDFNLLRGAVNAITQVTQTAHAVGRLNAGSPGVPPNPATIPDLDPAGGLAIAGESLDYQLAVFETQRRFATTPLGYADGARAALGNRFPALGAPLSNQWDIAATETTSPPWYMVAYSQYRYGHDVQVFIEDQPFARGSAVVDSAIKSGMGSRIQLLVDNYTLNDFGDTHSLVLIVDSLALQDALLQLVADNRRDDAAGTVTEVLRQASYLRQERDGDQGRAEGDVLENVLNALADLALGPGSAHSRLRGNPNGNTWANIDDGADFTGRESFYRLLAEVAGAVPRAADSPSAYESLRRNLILQTASTNLAAEARRDFLCFAALYSLSPFVFKLTAEAAVTGIPQELQAAWDAPGGLYRAWADDQADLLAGHGTANLRISDSWLADRAEFMDFYRFFNTANLNPADPRSTAGLLLQSLRPLARFDLYAGPDAVKDAAQLVNIRRRIGDRSFEDKTSRYTIAQGFETDQIPSSVRRIYFADDLGGRSTGGSAADNLYGATGHDALHGADGNDRLEGNFGNDTLEGDAGRDTLVGGSGDDELAGGTGNDLVQGGLGIDTYVFASGDGWDTIDDPGGEGRIRYDGITLAGGTPVGDSGRVWQQRDGNRLFTYLLVDWTEHGETFARLSIDGGDGGLFIRRWRPGDLGITLPGATPVEPSPPAAGRRIAGDHAPAMFSETVSSMVAGSDWRNVRFEVSTTAADGTPTTWTANYQRVDDLLNFIPGEPEARADFLNGSPGADSIFGYELADTLDGGAGDDTLDGGDDADSLRGGSGNDEMIGGAGVDWLQGNGGDDRLQGGSEPDRLSGDEGHDTLEGGHGADSLYGAAGNDLAGRKVSLYAGGQLFLIDGPANGHMQPSVNDFAWRVAA